MTDRIDHGAHQISWVGQRTSSGDPVPGAGTWEVVDHRDCAGRGVLRNLVPGDLAPPCELCAQPVTWQLSHLASSVAADHKGVGHLP
jgi:hypothetical protein